MKEADTMEYLRDILPNELKKGLTPAEKILLESVVKGREAVFLTRNAELDNPKNSAEWGIERTIRTTLIYWLCVSSEAVPHVHPKGVRIKGAKVSGELNFEGATLSKPLWITQSAIFEGIVLKEATTKTIGFTGSYTGPIKAEGIRVLGSMHLDEDFHVKGLVNILFANIEGNLVCDSGRFDHPESYAILAGGIIVKGDVLLCHKFHAQGEVRITGAKIGGILLCTGGRFENPEEEYDFKEFEFLERYDPEKYEDRIEGYKKYKKYAIFAKRINVKGTVYLSEDFHAQGEVCLVGADIGEQLDCSRGTFDNPKGIALNAQGIKVSSEISLIKAKFKGLLDLRNARVGSIEDEKKYWPETGNLRINGFEYFGFSGKAPTLSKDRLEWLRRQPRRPFRHQPYAQLARVYQQMGQESEAKKVLIAKQRELTRYGNLNFFTWLWRLILAMLIVYGYRPWRAFVYILIFVAIGTAIFGYADRKNMMVAAGKDYKDKMKILSEYPHYPRFNPIIYSLDTFVPIINFHQAQYWIPGTRHSRWTWTYLRIHIVMGWIFSTLAIAGVTGLVRKGFQ